MVSEEGTGDAKQKCLRKSRVSKTYNIVRGKLSWIMVKSYQNDAHHVTWEDKTKSKMPLCCQGKQDVCPSPRKIHQFSWKCLGLMGTGIFCSRHNFVIILCAELQKLKALLMAFQVKKCDNLLFCLKNVLIVLLLLFFEIPQLILSDR